MNLTVANDLCNARPHPGPLPRGEGESYAVSLVNLRLDSREAITNYREHSQAIPSPGGEGQGEGGRYTIYFESPHVVSYN